MTGESAPDFTAQTDDGVIFQLSRQRGRWVVAFFYPKDDTPG
jgi:peroxiredoxin Q/BCP